MEPLSSIRRPAALVGRVCAALIGRREDERRNTGRRFRATGDVAALRIPSHQVGRAPSRRYSCAIRSDGLDSVDECLTARFLIRTEDEVVRPQGLSFPATLITVENGRGLREKLPIAREDPRGDLSRTQGMLRQPAPEGRSAHGFDQALGEDRPHNPQRCMDFRQPPSELPSRPERGGRNCGVSRRLTELTLRSWFSILVLLPHGLAHKRQCRATITVGSAGLSL